MVDYGTISRKHTIVSGIQFVWCLPFFLERYTYKILTNQD